MENGYHNAAVTLILSRMAEMGIIKESQINNTLMRFCSSTLAEYLDGQGLEIARKPTEAA